jgi:hypothetical protein
LGVELGVSRMWAKGRGITVFRVVACVWYVLLEVLFTDNLMGRVVTRWFVSRRC